MSWLPRLVATIARSKGGGGSAFAFTYDGQAFTFAGLNFTYGAA